MHADITSAMQCPECRGALDWQGQRCTDCLTSFVFKGNRVQFTEENDALGQHQREIVLHDTLATEYQWRYQPDFAKVYSAYWNEQFLRHLPAKSDMILECGCGSGELLAALVKRADWAVGMDLSPAMLRTAGAMLGKEKNIALVGCPGEKIPFHDNTFDAICFRGALHHMAHEKEALAEAYRSLKGGGLLLLSEPNDDSLLLRLPRRLTNAFSERFGNDHKAFASRQWLQIIRDAGFHIESTKYFSFLSQPLCGMSDILPLMRIMPFAEKIARGMVVLDEQLSKIPLIKRQSFDLFVVARKK